jgi:uncharacterized membrane protein YdjX (TVP38/TMEM64 family)
MEMAEFGLPLLEWVTSAVPLFDNQIFVAIFLFAVTAGVIGLCIPGMLLPISFSAGILMDHWLAVPVVALGAVLGSHALFLVARYGMGDRLHARLAGRMERFAPGLERHGLAYVAVLRVIGTPHFLVTLASAAAPLTQRRFAIATLLGFLPAIALSAGAGTAF